MVGEPDPAAAAKPYPAAPVKLWVFEPELYAPLEIEVSPVVTEVSVLFALAFFAHASHPFWALVLTVMVIAAVLGAPEVGKLPRAAVVPLNVMLNVDGTVAVTTI